MATSSATVEKRKRKRLLEGFGEEIGGYKVLKNLENKRILKTYDK